jgi:Zn-finger protein
MDMNELRERTLIDLFKALDGIYGPNYECRYYPCHFSGQDCSFCYCPFYPCLIYDLGGELILSSEGEYVWSCKGCNWIHEKENVENVIFVLGRYPKQKLVESDWLFFNKVLQELYYGEELGEKLDNCYNLMPAVLKDKECEELDNVEFLAVKVVDFEILDVRRISSIEDANDEVVIPLKAGEEVYGIDKNGRKVVCKLNL